jgi:hypothetical protein
MGKMNDRGNHVALASLVLFDDTLRIRSACVPAGKAFPRIRVRFRPWPPIFTHPAGGKN